MLNIQVTPLFERIRGIDKRVVFLRGGARSSKSYSLMQLAAIWLWTGHIGDRYVPEGTFSIVRMTFPALRATVYRDFYEYLFKLGIYGYIDHRKTLNEFHFGQRSVSFFPSDDEQKLRGRKHTFAWLEEVNDMPYDVFHQISIRTEKQIFMSVNPSGEPWAKTEIEDKRVQTHGDVHVDVSTYHDNPFLSPEIKKEIESLKFTDESLYRIYSLGEWTQLKGLIFPSFKTFKSLDDLGVIEKTVIGLDWGYNDPTAIVRARLSGNKLYVDTLLYKSGMLIDEIADFIKDSVVKTLTIRCDSSDPRMIEELKRRGINAKPAKKGADSIMQGINFIKQHEIHIHEKSLEAQKEFRNYKWSEKDGVLLDKPIDKFNHVADALRYACEGLWSRKLQFI